MWLHDHGELTPPSDEDYRAVYDGPEPDFAEAFVKKLLSRLPEDVTEERHVRMLLARMIICDDLQGDFSPQLHPSVYSRRGTSAKLYGEEEANHMDRLLKQAEAMFGLAAVYSLAESLLYEVFLFS